MAQTLREAPNAGVGQTTEMELYLLRGCWSSSIVEQEKGACNKARHLSSCDRGNGPINKKYTRMRSEEARVQRTPVVTNFLFFCIIVSHRCFSVCNVLMSRHDLTTYSYSITVNILVYGTHTDQLPVIPTVCLWQPPGMLVRGRSSSTSSAGSLGESERYVPSFSLLPLRSMIGARH